MTECLFTGRWSARSPAWVADHVVMGTVVVPGTAFVELALHVADQLQCDVVEELVMESPLVFPEEGAVQVQVTVEAPDDDEGRRTVKVFSRSEHEASGGVGVKGTWTRHASCVLARAGVSPVERESLRARASMLADRVWPPPGAVGLEVNDFYEQMNAIGFDYGPAFSGVQALWRRGEELFVEVALPESERREAASYCIHPALFDAAIQPMAPRLNARDESLTSDVESVRLPFAFEGVRLHASGTAALRVHLSLVGDEAISMVAADELGELVASMRSLALRSVSRGRLASGADANRDAMFVVRWTAPAPIERSLDIEECRGLSLTGGLREHAGELGDICGSGFSLGGNGCSQHLPASGDRRLRLGK